MLAFYLVFVLLHAGPAKAASNDLQFRSSFTNEERLLGFKDHQEEAREFELKRRSGVGAVHRFNDSWNEMMRKSLAPFKREKAEEAAPLDESSKEYRESLKERQTFQRQLDESEKAYVHERDKALARQKSRILLTEEQEYDLTPEPVRVALRSRSLYSGKIKSSGGGSSSSGSFDAPAPIPAPPQIPSIPPPPMSNPNEFYEPEIPPPPSPLDGGFDDSIPPPIFDEPEF